MCQGTDGTGPAVQSAKLTVDGTVPQGGRTAIASGTNFMVRYAYVSGTTWTRDTVYSAAQTSAAIDITWHPTERERVYYTTAPAGGCTSRPSPAPRGPRRRVAPGILVQRFAVERTSAAVDVLYLVDLTNLRLYYGRNLMRRLLAILLLAPAAALIPAVDAHADPAGTTASTRFVFADEFNGLRGRHREMETTAPTRRRVQHLAPAELSSVSGGALNIALKKETYGGKDLHRRRRGQQADAGTATTRPARSSTRRRPAGHRSFWLMAGDGSTTFPASQRTEIDGFEIDLDQPDPDPPRRAHLEG